MQEFRGTFYLIISQVPHTYAENPPLARWVKRQRLVQIAVR